MANFDELLRKAEAQRGLPSGLLSSLVKQETGGQSKYIEKPDTYHYAPNAKGVRVAGHTGKVSTAFGPFGLLESTAKQPGYGVNPLKDKTLPEQIRFAADYLKARVDRAGDLFAGLAGYGEGPKYAQQVLSRVQSVPNVQVSTNTPISADKKVLVNNTPINEPISALVDNKEPIVRYSDIMTNRLKEYASKKNSNTEYAQYSPIDIAAVRGMANEVPVAKPMVHPLWFNGFKDIGSMFNWGAK